jgi:hypothetical protein
MNGADVIRNAFGAARHWYSSTVSDVTEELANYVPDGRAHPIGALMAHILQSEDGFIQGVLQGKPTIWEAGGWSARLGVPDMFYQDNATARGAHIDPEAIAAYQGEVYAATDRYLSALSDADLDREVDPFGVGPQPVGSALIMFVLGNTFAHTGEISALKGVQGAVGYHF